MRLDQQLAASNGMAVIVKDVRDAPKVIYIQPAEATGAKEWTLSLTERHQRDTGSHGRDYQVGLSH